MLKGFEDITYELTDHEMKTLVPILLHGFSAMCNTGRSYTNTHIRATLKKRYDFDVAESRLREMISYISQERQHEFGAYYLAASSEGYFMTKDIELIKKHAESLAGRIAPMQRRLDVAMKKLNCLSNGQIPFARR